MSFSVVSPHGFLTNEVASRVHCAPKTRLRLNRRGRLLVTILAMFPLLGGAFVFALNGGGAFATTAASGSSFDYVIVKPGQSLWLLAEQFAPDADPRDYITEIVTLNRLTSTSVDVGARLALPVKGNSD